MQNTENLPAYMIQEGDVAVLPGIDKPKTIYRVEDAGVRYERDQYGNHHIPQIRFHVNAPERNGGFGTVTLDFEHVVEVRLSPESTYYNA